MSRDKIADLGIWKDQISIEPLTGGLSNEGWKVTDAAGTHVVRFGHDYPFHHVDRQRELMTTRAAFDAGIAPEVEFSAPGVMVSKFIDARTWQEEDVRNAPDRVAELIRKFHEDLPQYVSGPGYIFWVFHVVRDYARTLQAGNSPFKNEIGRYLRLAQALEAAQIPMPIVFGHNDLLPANILDDGNRLWLIDFEYAGFSTSMFDLAGAASNSGMGDAEARILLESYFQEPVDEQTLKAFDAMQCASLLREAMWAMVSQLHLDAPGADYGAYAQENLDRLEKALQQYQEKHGKLPQ